MALQLQLDVAGLPRNVHFDHDKGAICAIYGRLMTTEIHEENDGAESF